MGKTVRDYTEKMISMAEPGKAVRMAYEYILRNGEYFEGALPSSVLPRTALVQILVKPRKAWCFYNAQMLSLLHPLRNILYYEGVADNGVFIGAHAWNLYEGRVVDITWEDIPREFADIPDVRPIEKFQYFGVKIPNDFVRKNNPIAKAFIEPLLFKYLMEH